MASDDDFEMLSAAMAFYGVSEEPPMHVGDVKMNMSSTQKKNAK